MPEHRTIAKDEFIELVKEHQASLRVHVRMPIVVATSVWKAVRAPVCSLAAHHRPISSVGERWPRQQLDLLAAVFLCIGAGVAVVASELDLSDVRLQSFRCLRRVNERSAARHRQRHQRSHAVEVSRLWFGMLN